MPFDLLNPVSGSGDSRFALADLEEEASELVARAEELRELVARCDPFHLVSSISAPAALVVVDPDAEDDATSSFSVDAKIEYLVGVALAGPPGSGDVDAGTREKTLELVASVFDAAQARMFIQAQSDQPTEDISLNQTSLLFRQERLVDRMPGYDIHLEEISDAVFEPHRSLYCEELGFCPSDAVRLVRRHSAWTSTVFNAEHDEIFEATGLERPDEDAAAFDARCLALFKAVSEWTPALLARTTQIPAEQIEAILRNMSSDFGCQPEFKTPFDDNQARLRPLIQMPNGAYLAAAQSSVARGIHDWLQDYIRNNPASPLKDSYPRHRSRAAERLVHESLEHVFGKPAVFAQQHYDTNDGHGAVDCLVASSTPVIVEVKSATLTEQGRRGLPLRIKTVARKGVGKAFKQTRRARSYIVEEGGRCFADRQGGQLERLLADDVGEPVEIVVTLERMDPLTMAGGELASDGRPRSVWVTSVADFLMVRDILDHPASFLHYARTRGTTSGLGIQIFMESDALGAYLISRLAPLIDRAAEYSEDDHVLGLGYVSTEINTFFLLEGADAGPEKPGVGIPEAVLEALRSTAIGYLTPWMVVSTAVMAAPLKTWHSWRRFVRSNKGEHPFLLPCRTASLVASTSLSQPELRHGATPTLAIPRHQIEAAASKSDGVERYFT